MGQYPFIFRGGGWDRHKMASPDRAQTQTSQPRVLATSHKTTLSPISYNYLKQKFASVWCLLFTVFGFSQVGYFTGSNQQNLPASIMSDLDDVLVPVIHSAANNQRVHSLSVELLFKVLRLLWQTQLPDTSPALIHANCMQRENMLVYWPATS